MAISIQVAKVAATPKWDRTKTNLEQYRAQLALSSADDIEKGVGGGQAVAKKVPTMIRENGFLGALAFAVEKKSGNALKNPAHASVFEAVRKYLVGIGMVTASDTDGLMKDMASESADKLRLVTSESIAFLNYLRRFARPDKDGGKDD